jgi:hypothetical protein
MARGRTTSLTIRLAPAERLTLLAWQRATSMGIFAQPLEPVH